MIGPCILLTPVQRSQQYLKVMIKMCGTQPLTVNGSCLACERDALHEIEHSCKPRNGQALFPSSTGSNYRRYYISTPSSIPWIKNWKYLIGEWNRTGVESHTPLALCKSHTSIHQSNESPHHSTRCTSSDRWSVGGVTIKPLSFSISHGDWHHTGLVPLFLQTRMQAEAFSSLIFPLLTHPTAEHVPCVFVISSSFK